VLRFERQLKQTLGQLHAEQQRTIGVCNEKDHQVAVAVYSVLCVRTCVSVIFVWFLLSFKKDKNECFNYYYVYMKALNVSMSKLEKQKLGKYLEDGIAWLLLWLARWLLLSSRSLLTVWWCVIRVHLLRDWQQTVCVDHIQLVSSSSSLAAHKLTFLCWPAVKHQSINIAAQARHVLLVEARCSRQHSQFEQLYLVKTILLKECYIKTLVAFDNIVICISY